MTVLSDIYAGMGSDAPAVFMLHREAVDPEVVVHLVFDGEPQSKARARMARNGHVYTPRNTRDAMDYIGARFREVKPDWTPNDEDSYGVIALFFCGTRQRRDVDNMLKLILDGLNKVAWVDDAQVTEVSGRLSRGVDSPRTEVVVYRTLTQGPATRPCLHCGKPFRDYPSQRQSRKFCTKECGYAYRKAQRTRVCKHCGQEFSHRGSDESPKFCSVGCRAASGRTTGTCLDCGASFTVTTTVFGRTKYPACSPECRAAIWRRVRRGDAP